MRRSRSVQISKKVTVVPLTSASSSDSDSSSDSSIHPDIKVFGSLATDESLYSILRPAQIRSEHFDFPWNLDNFSEFETGLSNVEDSNDGSIIRSPTFQCGLMADRLAQWHLELNTGAVRVTEEAENYVGLSLVLEKILWKNDKNADIFINAQLLDASGSIFESCKSPKAISFGRNDQFTRFTWNDFILLDKLLQSKELLLGPTNMLRLMLRMDIRGGSGPRSTSLMKSSTENEKAANRLKRDPTEMLCKEFFDSVSLKKSTEELWRSGRRSDITIQAGGKEFRAHKVMLRSSSTVFADLLREKKRNESPNFIQIDGFEPTIVENLLEYIYTQTCPVFHDLLKAGELLRLGKLYKVRALKTDLMEHLIHTVTVKNALETLLFAHVQDGSCYVIERLTWYCKKHAAAIRRMDTFIDLFGLDPEFFSEVFKDVERELNSESYM